MTELNLNHYFKELLNNHGIEVQESDEFIQTNLPNAAVFKARSVYIEQNSYVSSRLDVMAITNTGEKIMESCGDVGETIEDALSNNFHNFCEGSLHPLLAAFGSTDASVAEQITIEEWSINGRLWDVYIGNLVPKMLADNNASVEPPSQFFEAIEKQIMCQPLTRRLHWFRSYYNQVDNKIEEREFLMDNEPLDAQKIFESLPLIPGVHFYSCRNFIVCRNKE